MILFASLLIISAIAVYLFMRQPQFGRMASGERLEKIKNSPHYADGSFQNLSLTPNLAENVSYYKVLKEFIFDKSNQSNPPARLPSQKTNLHTIDPGKNLLVWFGHSSYFMQINGKKILVDPVFSDHASPVSFTTKSYPGTDVYTADDMPVIDYLFISHDHWDHLDYATMLQLKPKIKKLVTGLGTGAHLEHWGYAPSVVTETDWNDQLLLDEGFTVYALPARHFSGRGFARNQSLWMSFALHTPGLKIYIGGDSGYDTHFAKIGATYGPFDLAILECGQYNPNWKYIHMMPEELIQAGQDLRAKAVLPVHWGKFSLAQHAWDEPVRRVTAEGERKNFPVIHPMIGEEVNLDSLPVSTRWWEKITH